MSLADTTRARGRPDWLAIDKVGVLVGLVGIVGLILPFALFRANRIVLGEARSLLEALPSIHSGFLLGLAIFGLIVALLRVSPLVKLLAGALVLAALFVMVGNAAGFLTPDGDTFARVSPGAGFWLLLLAFSLLVTDALTRMRLGPWTRIAILPILSVAMAALLWSGAWNDLSILKEYSTRASAFWAEGATHLVLSFGSVAAATLVGVPLGMACYRFKPLRANVLNTLNIIQTIPSIAMFGLLIAPLAWLSANVPFLSAIGVSGIGAAPALLALFAYSLLPIVSNTVVGLLGVPPGARDAAKGMGMTAWQRLLQVEMPLALPVILTGIRIVLVQNIGITTIAALIGGGGFGVFVFQGIGQTAMDLVLLGAVPTVLLAFGSAVLLDAIIEITSRGDRRA